MLTVDRCDPGPGTCGFGQRNLALDRLGPSEGTAGLSLTPQSPYSSVVPLTMPALMQPKAFSELRSPTATRSQRLGAAARGVGFMLIRAASPNPTASPRPSHTHPAAHVVPASTGTPLSIALPTWIGAIATVVLAVGAGFTVYYARKAFREQSKEVRILQKETERDIQQRRRSQASRVFIHQEAAPAEHDPQMAAAQMDAAIRSCDETTTLIAARLSNTSKQPVYDIAIRWSIGGAPLGGPHVEPYLMPSEELLCTQGWTPSAGITGLAVKVEFSDAVGVRWRATDRGELAELCSATRPPPDTAHCGHAPGHKGDHRWDPPANKLLVADSTAGATDDPR